MEFRRSGQRDERRRRVLIDETGLDISSRSASGMSGAGSEAPARCAAIQGYTDAALSPRRPRVVDLIPARWWSILVLVSLALSCVAGLEAIYGYVALGHTRLNIAAFSAIDLAAPGNIASWLSCCLLLASAVLGVLTYQIRRHRVDDYRGRYRMWYWMVAVLVVASLDQVADLQTSVRTLLLHVAGIPDYADALLVWFAAMTVVVGAILVRLAIEMRGCRLAVASLIITMALYLTAATTRLDWLEAGAGVFRVMVLAGLILGGHIALFLAQCLYARHVYRDACGQVAHRPKKVRRAIKAASDGAARDDGSRRDQGSSRLTTGGRIKGKKTRRDPAHTSSVGDPEEGRGASRPKPVGRQGKERKVAAATAAPAVHGAVTGDEEAAGDLDESRKRSKAERRRLRKQRRRSGRQE